MTSDFAALIAVFGAVSGCTVLGGGDGFDGLGSKGSSSQDAPTGSQEEDDDTNTGPPDYGEPEYEYMTSATGTFNTYYGYRTPIEEWDCLNFGRLTSTGIAPGCVDCVFAFKLEVSDDGSSCGERHLWEGMTVMLGLADYYGSPAVMYGMEYGGEYGWYGFFDAVSVSEDRSEIEFEFIQWYDYETIENGTLYYLDYWIYGSLSVE